MTTSAVQVGAQPIPFPAFTGERVYMRRIDGGVMPPDLARWGPTVQAMMADVEANGPVYLMVDQMRVRKGETHRRPGMHVDGWWDEKAGRHGGHVTTGIHRPGEGMQTLVLAATHEGCRAFVGDYDGEVVGDGGDCAAVSIIGMESVPMKPGVAYHGDAATLLHESVACVESCERTVVRLNVFRMAPEVGSPGEDWTLAWEPWQRAMWLAHRSNL